MFESEARTQGRRRPRRRRTAQVVTMQHRRRCRPKGGHFSKVPPTLTGGDGASRPAQNSTSVFGYCSKRLLKVTMHPTPHSMLHINGNLDTKCCCGCSTLIMCVRAIYGMPFVVRASDNLHGQQSKVEWAARAWGSSKFPLWPK